MHYPYTAFLQGTGLTVKIFRLQWHTTAFNRSIVKWSTKYPKLFYYSFTVGVYFVFALVPLASILLTISAFHIADKSSDTSKINENIRLEILLPGVNLPFDEIGFYVVSLAICSIVHELGHGLAAVLEDVAVKGFGMHVMFVIPIAYTEFDSDQVNALKLWKKLRIICAGIWHNLILAFFSYLLFLSTPFLLSSFYDYNNSIILTDIKNTAPIYGARGFDVGDVILSVNNCQVQNDKTWFKCLYETIRFQPAYCLATDYVHQNDESESISHTTDGLIQCCDVKNTKSICFEYLLDKIDDEIALPQHLCLNMRKTIQNNLEYCHKTATCTNGFCFKPILNNATTILQITRKNQNDVIYIGHPSDLTRNTKISNFVPKFKLFPSYLADSFYLLLKYITVFSLGLAIANALPCFGFDGQHLVTVMIHNFLGKIVSNKGKRDLIALCTNIVGTLFILLTIMKILWLNIFTKIIFK